MLHLYLGICHWPNHHWEKIYYFFVADRQKLFIKKHCENHKKLHREHLICCWGVKLFLLKDVTITAVTTNTVTTVIFFILSLVTNRVLEFCHNLSFFSFVTIWVYKFCHNLCFWVSSKFEFLSFLPIWVLEFCHNLSFWVFHNLSFLSFVTIYVFELCHNLNFSVLSKFEFLSFVPIQVFEFCHNLCFWVLSQFGFLSFDTIFRTKNK